MPHGAGAILEHLAPKQIGVMGLCWGESREQVYEHFIQRSWVDEENAGASLFVFMRGVIAGCRTRAHVGFANGLHGVTFIFDSDFPEALVDNLRYGLFPELRSRYGEPEHDQEIPGEDTHIRIWKEGSITLIQHDSPLYLPRLTVRRTQYPKIRPLPPHLVTSDRSVTLEEVAPGSKAIQDLMQSGDTARAAQLEQHQRLLLGSCPFCGLSIGGGHGPRCPYRQGQDKCATCGLREAEGKNECLHCVRDHAIKNAVATYGQPIPTRLVAARQTGSSPAQNWSDLSFAWWTRRVAVWLVVVVEVYVVLGLVMRAGALLEDVGFDVMDSARPMFLPTGLPLLAEIVGWGLMIPGVEWVRRKLASAFERTSAEIRDGLRCPNVTDIQGVVRVAGENPHGASLLFPRVLGDRESSELLRAWTKSKVGWTVLTPDLGPGIVLTKCPAAWKGAHLPTELGN